VDAGRPVHCEAQNAEQAPNAKAEGVAPGGVAAGATVEVAPDPIIINRDDISGLGGSSPMAAPFCCLVALSRLATSKSARFGAASPTQLCETSCTSSLALKRRRVVYNRNGHCLRYRSARRRPIRSAFAITVSVNGFDGSVGRAAPSTMYTPRAACISPRALVPYSVSYPIPNGPA
jgi:hypothetical protein